jgi:subtilisin-like proprotein convertase family protein
VQRSRAQFTRWMVTAVTCALALAGGARTVWADANQTPIAVPLIGNTGPGSPYPSRITVASRGGPAQTGQPFIMLHAVTHPCIEDLAILLVHNSAEKYLLMSHAGGCKALQGTDLIFTPAGTPIPDTDPSPATPYAQTEVTSVSNYGAVPVFPSPAPAGPYLTTYPNTFYEGTWDLYVIDTGAGNRGVIAAGWSFNYPTTYTFNATPPFPVAINDDTSAARYPINFDLTAVPAGVKVWKVTVNVSLSHTFPDDINMVLQAPNGAFVLLMANAGGTFDLVNTALAFSDSGAAMMPDNAQILAGTYKPTAYGTVQNPPGNVPAAASAYNTALSLAALNGQDARGTWKLWVYDDAVSDTGSIASASITVQTEPTPILFNIDTPTTGTTYTANTPFLHLEGEIEDGGATSQHTATWYSLNGGVYYASGPMEFTPGSQIIKADIPLKKGTNFINVYVRNTGGVSLATDDLDVTVNEFVYTLSEGATGGFFDLDVTAANPTGLPAPLAIQFLPEHSAPIPYASNVVANGQTQLHVDDLTPGDAVSTIVHSTDAIPLAVERTMSWDSTGYGGSGGTAIFPSKHWIFAEGSQGYFDTFLLLSNNGATSASVNVKFLVEGGSPVNVPVSVPANKRVTVYAGDVAAIRNTSFGMDVTADQPITAERSMYFPHDGPRIWEGGHETGGVTDVSTHWFLAEGATGPFFE